MCYHINPHTPKKNPAHTSARPIGPSVRRRMQGATWLASDVINHTCNRRRLAGPSERKWTVTAFRDKLWELTKPQQSVNIYAIRVRVCVRVCVCVLYSFNTPTDLALARITTTTTTTTTTAVSRRQGFAVSGATITTRQRRETHTLYCSGLAS